MAAKAIRIGPHRDWQAIAIFAESLVSHCGVGNDGRSMYGEGNKATGYSGSVVVDNQQAALFKTNIDGIYYAVSLQTQGGGTVVYIPAAGPSIHWLNGMSNTTLEGTTWKASIVLFQSTRFSGNTSNINALQPDISDGTQLSKMGRGDPDASAKYCRECLIFPVSCQTSHLSGHEPKWRRWREYR